MGLERPQRSLERVVVSARCERIGCRAQARGTLRVRHRGAAPQLYALTPAARRLAAGHSAKLRPAIPPAARTAARDALRRGGTVWVKVRLRAKPPAGQQRVRVRWARILPG